MIWSKRMTKQKAMEDLRCLNQVSGDASLIQTWHNRDPIGQNSTILAPKRTIKGIILETEETVLQTESDLKNLVKYPHREFLAQAGQVEFLVAQTKSQ